MDFLSTSLSTLLNKLEPFPQKLQIQVLKSSDLDYENMALPPPTTINSTDIFDSYDTNVKGDGAFVSEVLPWSSYTIEAWYCSGLDKHLVKAPVFHVLLTPEIIKVLQEEGVSCSDERLGGIISKLDEHCNSKIEVFVRTSMCSTKIGTTPKPCTSGKTVIKSILDCQRCIQSLSCPSVQHNIWLFPWNEECDLTREFRVFIQNQRIVAIGPYYCSLELDYLTSPVANSIGLAILKFWEEEISPLVPNIDNAVMDVLKLDGEPCKLIEFNPRESSGGGLFNYLEDRRIMEGRQNATVMRIIRG